MANFIPDPVVTQARFALRLVLGVAMIGLLSGCRTLLDTAPHLPSTNRLEILLPTPVLLLGEQHEAPRQPELQLSVVQQLVERGALAALLLEMAERGRDTRHLTQMASETDVQDALGWVKGWPWSRYGPTVMAAVRAGVPVIGANLPRQAMRRTMTEAALDTLLDAPSLTRQHDNIRQGHCGLLPEEQIPGMARIQIARDRSMAEAVVAAWRSGQTVVLLAGNEHVRSDLGIPRHLSVMPVPWPAVAGPVRVVRMQARAEGVEPVAPATHRIDEADVLWETPAYVGRDHCEELRQQWKPR